jgi:hypothetical protein
LFIRLYRDDGFGMRLGRFRCDWLMRAGVWVYNTRLYSTQVREGNDKRIRLELFVSSS